MVGRVGGGTFDEDLEVVLLVWRILFFVVSFLTYPLVVDDLNDGCQSADVRALREHCDAADLDEAPVAGGD